jgi:subtilisin family serine protease
MATVDKHEILFNTDTNYFKAIQLIGGKSIFVRYKIANTSIIGKYIGEKYRHFLAYPVIEGDKIEFHGIKAKNDSPQILAEMHENDAIIYQNLKAETLHHYQSKIEELENTGKTTEAEFLTGAIKSVDDRFIFCYDNKVVLGAWGMQMRENVPEDINIIRKKVLKTKRKICFIAGEGGILKGQTEFFINNGENVDESHIPQVEPNDGYEFAGWDENPIGYKIISDKEFTARYRQITVEPAGIPFTVSFNAGESGNINGQTEFSKFDGDFVTENEIPQVAPIEGYEFAGWDENPSGYSISSNKEFTALYKQIPPVIPPTLPWWKRFWLWLTALFAGRGCLKWLLRILLFLMLLFLLLWLLRNCHGCHRIGIDSGGALGDNDTTWLDEDPNRGYDGGIYDPYNPYDPVPTPPGYEDILPPHEGLLPPLEDNPEIIPGDPSIVANRLNILMENEDKSIMDLAKDFKEKYPDEKYKVVYYDNVVKRMQIEIPEEERENLKQEIPPAFASEYDLFVFDEALFEGAYRPNDPAISDPNKAWYLDAINAFQAWDITRGSEEVTVAIVDNGFNLSHPELKSKVVQPYNVWTQSAKIFPQQVDHGTHVAGTAIAMADNGKGICGIAPNCKFMPVQVANEQERMTTTSILDGILYALYQGADVINVSLGSMFTGLAQYGEAVQKDMINNHFKEEERLWRHVMRIAAGHNSSIVIAAGNDNVLAGIDAIQRPELFITVSAVDKNNRSDNKAGFSNYGQFSDISAPGVGIYSSVGKSSYQTMDGTSMAAPIISGAVALMKSLNTSITNKQILCILQNTGLETQGNIGKLLQLDKALLKVKSGEAVDCTPEPTTGDVQVLLSWDNYNDLDLLVTDPYNERIWYKNRRVSSGGQLEIDMNVEYPDSRNPIENIYWPSGAAPNGTYNVYLMYFKQHQNTAANPYKIIVKHGSVTDEYSGTIDELKKPILICTFTMGNSSNVESPPNENPNNPDTRPENNRRSELEQERDSLQQELDRVNSELRNIRR